MPKFIVPHLNVKPCVHTNKIYSRLTPIHSRFPSIINTDGKNAAVDPRWGRVIPSLSGLAHTGRVWEPCKCTSSVFIATCTILQSEMFRHSLIRFLGFPDAFRRPGIFSPNFVRHRKNPPALAAMVRRAQSGGTERFEVPLPGHKYYRYHDVQKDRDLVMKRLLEDPKRFQKIAEREDRSDTNAEAFRASFDGKYFTFHRGIDVMKGCHDIVIYMQLFWHVKPATIIEIGVASGGTTIWMADMLKLMDIECNIYSMDSPS